MIYSDTDPTLALFTSEAGACRVGNWLTANHPNVKFCTVKLRYERQEPKGYVVIAHHVDDALTAPITNSDVEEVERRLDADMYA